MLDHLRKVLLLIYGAMQNHKRKNGRDSEMVLNERQAKRLNRRYGINFFPKVKDAARVSGAETAFEPHTQHPPGQFMPLGAYSYAQSYIPKVSFVGRYCSLASGIEAMGSAHPVDWVSSSPAFYRRRRAWGYGSKRMDFPQFEDQGASIEIGHDVWIGDDALLAHGIKIGTGAVVAARSIVTKDVPPYAIVAGSPAQVVRMRFADDLIERLLASAWWSYPINVLDAADPMDVPHVLDLIEALPETQERLPEQRYTVSEYLSGAARITVDLAEAV